MLQLPETCNSQSPDYRSRVGARSLENPGGAARPPGWLSSSSSVTVGWRTVTCRRRLPGRFRTPQSRPSARSGNPREACRSEPSSGRNARTTSRIAATTPHAIGNRIWRRDAGCRPGPTHSVKPGRVRQGTLRVAEGLVDMRVGFSRAQPGSTPALSDTHPSSS